MSTKMSRNFVAIKSWRKQDGLYVAIQDMEDSHIVNTIRFLMRNIGPELIQYEMYFALHGEVMVEVAESLGDRTFSMNNRQRYRSILSLRMELEDRGKLDLLDELTKEGQ